jgi:hypothetical protein
VADSKKLADKGPKTQRHGSAGSIRRGRRRWKGGPSQHRPLQTSQESRHANVGLLGKVFPLKVHRKLKQWPERGQRKRKWFKGKRAARLIGNKELRRAIRKLVEAEGGERATRV